MVARESTRVEQRPLLLVEDNPVNQEVLKESLSRLGYAADVVDNGRLALEALDRKTYPLILMDCQMPVLDGYATAREIRRREAGRAHVPIIAVTAHAFEGEREKVLSAGMDDYIVKPLKQAVLLDVLQRWWPGAPVAVVPESGEREPESSPRRDSERPPGDAVRRVFLRSVPEQLDELSRAITVSDARLMAAAAHKLKGGCLAVGARRMASLCAELETIPGERVALRHELELEFGRVAARWSKPAPVSNDSGQTG
jgi:CheY-like chemotaxis protein